MKFYLSILQIFVCLIASAQNSITWNTGMNISTNAYSNMHPRMTLDGAGSPLVVWGKMSDESAYFSRWNGTAFTTPVKLNPSWLKVANASWMGPDIASKGDTVYVVVKRAPETSDTNHIYIMRSFNGGVSFLAPVRVDYIGDSVSRFPTVTVDATGNPIVAFMKFNSSFLKSRWVVTKSTDFGQTFTTDVRASGYSGTNAEVCDCCPGAIVSSGNNTAMLYRDNLSNIREIWTGISKNNNASFNSGFMVDNTNWMIMSCPSSGPDGIIIGDSLYTVFLSGAGSYRTYLSKSSISGGMVSSVAKLTGNITGLSQQNYPRIATDGKAAAIVWKQTVSGSSQLPILFTNDIAKGFSSPSDTVDLADITNTDVAMYKGKIFVVWQDDGSGTVKYRSGTYTQLPTGINEIAENNFSVYPNPVSSTLTLLSNFDLQNAEVTVFNLLGETVLTQNQISNATLNVVSLTNGIYFLQVRANNKFFTQKFIKQ